jgi:hypothetical protein
MLLMVYALPVYIFSISRHSQLTEKVQTSFHSLISFTCLLFTFVALHISVDTKNRSLILHVPHM